MRETMELARSSKTRTETNFPKDEKLMRFVGTENSMFVKKGFLKLLY
jgi:hypothetical protein